ncbi:uncharacterized protein LOC118196104 [Stegodyphus dumicola]|uniref:uncharacterized protein LOC118196104 n=1 Tax=Stegodyphus dumicola TaxID=202533 RepID=UPI0015A911A1|nr:uncharacterized protein LOC118196104 [Stegodyphus dumicola]
MSLFHIPPGMLDSVPIEDTELKYDFVDGAYELELSANFTEDELEDQRFFGCVVSMNGTGYEEEIQIPYLPAPKAEKQESDDDSDENAASKCTGVFLVATFFLTLLFLLT